MTPTEKNLREELRLTRIKMAQYRQAILDTDCAFRQIIEQCASADEGARRGLRAVRQVQGWLED